jgi:hypothetical protein
MHGQTDIRNNQNAVCGCPAGYVFINDGGYEMDRETIITHLHIIHTWAEFARERDLQFFTAKHLEDIAQWADDALKLLKAQSEIIRCKDCKREEVCCIRRTNDPNWFCADGKERVVK